MKKVKKDLVVTLRLDQELYDKLVINSFATGLKLSAYIRNLLFQCVNLDHEYI